MKVGKPQSKRTPVRLRHKIEKASAAKQRKQRKEAKKNPQWRSRLKKDPGIPNLFPYKAKVLAEIEEAKRRKEEEQKQRREIAKAQRQGDKTVPVTQSAEIANDEDLLDLEGDEEEDIDMQEDTNPMAALLASAQARARTHDQNGNDDSFDGESDDELDQEQAAPQTHSSLKLVKEKSLPAKALADPIKAVSILLERMQGTADGVQRLLDHYQIPPLVTAGSDITSRFLVEVARKCGRLGRGGIPNLHSAALTVLTDLNEDRLQLPAANSSRPAKHQRGVQKGAVQVVSQMAEPFRIEGLFGDESLDGDSQPMEDVAMKV